MFLERDEFLGKIFFVNQFEKIQKWNRKDRTRQQLTVQETQMLQENYQRHQFYTRPPVRRRY